jgi:hypothetical protein
VSSIGRVGDIEARKKTRSSDVEYTEEQKECILAGDFRTLHDQGLSIKESSLARL